MNKNKIAITLGIVCIVLTMAIVVQVKTIKTANSVVAKTLEENSLRDDVLKWKDKYDSTYRQWEEADSELKKIREEATKNNSTSEEIEKKIKLNNNLLGLTNLKGKGVIITLEDDPNATRETLAAFDDISNHIVHYLDIINIVNELKNAGAEAISVNGQRIVNTTSINCIGNVIKINNQKINSPFTIKAIGFPESLISLNRPGGYLESLKDYGMVVTVKKSDNVEIEKYGGLISAKFMKFQK